MLQCVTPCPIAVTPVPAVYSVDCLSDGGTPKRTVTPEGGRSACGEMAASRRPRRHSGRHVRPEGQRVEREGGARGAPRPPVHVEHAADRAADDRDAATDDRAGRPEVPHARGAAADGRGLPADPSATLRRGRQSEFRIQPVMARDPRQDPETDEHAGGCNPPPAQLLQ